MIEELWKPVVNFEGIYEVSNLGRVRSVERVAERNFNFSTRGKILYKSKVMKPMVIQTSGYIKYGLSNNSKIIFKTAHRLVAEAWIPNPDNLPQVHHRDHNKENNCVENLEWVTASKNVREAIKAGRFKQGFKSGLSHHNSRFTSSQKSWMKVLNKDGYSLDKLAEVFNTSKGTLSVIISGKKDTQSTYRNSGELKYCKPLTVNEVIPLVYKF